MGQHTCKNDHVEIEWTAFCHADTQCPVCSVMADLRKVSAQLAEAEVKLALDNYQTNDEVRP